MIARRAVLAGAAGLGVGGASLAAALVWRKPGGPEIATLRDVAPQHLGSLAGLVRTAPPGVLPARALQAGGFVDAAGGAQDLARFAGRGVVVNFWATWCAPCVAEMPALQGLATALGEAAMVLPLSSDRGGAAVVRAFYAAHGIDGLGVWLDARGALAEAFGARGLPTTVLIDRAGREVGRIEGAVDWAAAATVAGVRGLIL